MAFHFSLNGVLRLRESLEKAELQNLRVIAVAVAFSRAELDSLDKDMETARRWTLDATVTRGLTGAELHFEVLREGVLRAVRSSLAEKLAGLERKREEQQQRYLHARQQREILSSLYQRQLAAYRVQQSRREQQRIDELFLIRSNFTAPYASAELLNLPSIATPCLTPGKDFPARPDCSSAEIKKSLAVLLSE